MASVAGDLLIDLELVLDARGLAVVQNGLEQVCDLIRLPADSHVVRAHAVHCTCRPANLGISESPLLVGQVLSAIGQSARLDVGLDVLINRWLPLPGQRFHLVFLTVSAEQPVKEAHNRFPEVSR